MPRGANDYDINTGAVGAYSADVSELAARLGANNVIHRLGHEILSDDFSEGLQGWGLTLPVDGSVKVRIDKAWKGNGCARIMAPSSGTAEVVLFRGIPLLDQSKMGCELVISWEYSGVSVPSIFTLLMLYETGSRGEFYGIRINPETKAVYVLDGTQPAYGFIQLDTLTGTIKQTATFTSWQWLKLVINLESTQHDKLLLNNLAYDLSGYPPLVVPDTNIAHLWTYLQFYPVATPLPVNLDSVIITINEP